MPVLYVVWCSCGAGDLQQLLRGSVVSSSPPSVDAPTEDEDASAASGYSSAQPAFKSWTCYLLPLLVVDLLPQLEFQRLRFGKHRKVEDRKLERGEGNSGQSHQQLPWSSTWGMFGTGSNARACFDHVYTFTLTTDMNGAFIPAGPEIRTRTRTGWIKRPYRNDNAPIVSTIVFGIANVRVINSSTIEFIRLDSRPGHESRWKMKGTLSKDGKTMTVSLAEAFGPNSYQISRLYTEFVVPNDEMVIAEMI
ncbi:hypothetical protein BT96DRAFT_933393 [Gymnopus androsaceus JB14]|uniref:Uncharacterized protein n=1 Tax=Gymnopus androsaceus JB14 TaxID=1447944 RepID=A0A6A4I5U2_9AGAR|nr:hypothetical protein BT96DRAFT_933393 [Gymnopus androsaceus JB14]